MINTAYQERRTSERTTHRGYGTVKYLGQYLPCSLINVSKSGALISMLSPHKLQRGETFELSLELEKGIIRRFQAQVIRPMGDCIGLKYT